MSQSVYSMVIPVGRRAERPLAKVVESHLEALIDAGVLRAGERLPSSRELAIEMGVNRGVLLKAVRALESRGRLTTRIGSGITVSPGAGPGSTPRQHGVSFSTALSRLSAGDPDPVSDEPVFVDFSRLAPDPASFPTEDFARILSETFRRGRELLQYASPYGLAALRDQIARRMRESGAPWTAQEIVVTSGAQQGLDLIFKACVDPGDPVAVESPTYPGVLPLMRFYGAETVEIPIAEAGHDLSSLTGRALRLIYVMPGLHNPTGASMEMETRRRLMACAMTAGAIVVEDGYETPSDGRPPLSSLDPSRVITLGSFSKELAPGFRVGWIAAAAPVLRAIALVKQTADFQTPLPLQAAIAEFLRQGGEEDVRRRRLPEIESRRSTMARALRAELPEWKFRNGAYGSALFWLELPAGVSGREAARSALARGVRVAPGADFDPRGRDLPALRLSVSRVDPLLLEEGVARLAAALRETVQKGGMARAIPLV